MPLCNFIGWFQIWSDSKDSEEDGEAEEYREKFKLQFTDFPLQSTSFMDIPVMVE